MFSQLIAETTKKNKIEEVKVFKPSKKGGLWECPFCDPSDTVYKLTVPPENETERMLLIKRLIKKHIELHQKDLLGQMMSEKDYESTRAESIKRVRHWINGTVAVRRLYRENPLEDENV